MGSNRILGVVLIVVGLILLYFGLQAADSLGESIKEGITGTYTDTTTWYIVGGAALVVVGALLALFGGGRRANSA